MLSQVNRRGALVDVIAARGGAHNTLAVAARETALALAGVVFIALSSRVLIPLPNTPVPITAQTFAVLLLAGAYGARRGVAAVALYMVAGAAGLPVFAPILGSFTYGYIVGFLLAAVVVGWLADHGWDRSLLTSIIAMAAGEAAIYLCGLAWLAHFFGWGKAIGLGLTPFLVGDALKLLAAALLLPGAWWLTRRAFGGEAR